jgi:hypothetical protein
MGNVDYAYDDFASLFAPGFAKRLCLPINLILFSTPVLLLVYLAGIRSTFQSYFVIGITLSF